MISSDNAFSNPAYPKQDAGRTLFNDLTVLEYRAKSAENENIPIYVRFLDKFRQ